MSDNLKDRSGDTVRILRPPPRVYTDPCGQNVWMGEVEAVDLELVSPEDTDPYNSADSTSEQPSDTRSPVWMTSR